MKRYSVSLTVNTCPTDICFLSANLGHIIRTLDYPFLERVLIVDVSEPQGRFRYRRHGNADQLLGIAEELATAGVVDRIEQVPWIERNIRFLFEKYFGTTDVASRSTGGTAVYQYLFGLEACSGDYVLHVDSDMLFYCNSQHSWIDEAVQEIRESSQVMFAALAHPPRARNLIEWIVGRSISTSPSPRWSVSQDVSTRCFLYDKGRLEEDLLPLETPSPNEHLEQAMTHSLRTRDYVRHSLFDDRNWAVHPKPHNEVYCNVLGELVWGVEQGIFPFRRGGRHPWDLYTYRRHLAQWLFAIRVARLLRHRGQ